MTTPNTACRRCADCVGQEHHWIENHRLEHDGDPYFICKHCDAACHESNPEEGIAEPSGEVVEQPAICDGCDLYQKGCECGVEPDCSACLHPESECTCPHQGHHADLDDEDDENPFEDPHSMSPDDDADMGFGPMGDDR